MLRLRQLCLAFLLIAAAPSAVPQQKHDLTVSAAITMKDALDGVAILCSALQPGTSFHLNLGASGTLQHQIEQGAPVDVFVSASPDQMNALAAQGLLFAGTRKDLVENEVVLIVPVGRSTVSSFLLGQQSRAVFEKYGFRTAGA